MRKLELHILQNFSPSCLNRDDTNAPKDCEFGGVRRARISSQCLKRAVRDAFESHGLIDGEQRAVRTKLLAEEVAKELANRGHDLEVARTSTQTVLQAISLGVKPQKDGRVKTEYLLFLPKRSLKLLADLVHENWGTIATSAPAAGAPGPNASAGKAPGVKPKKTSKGAKGERELPKEIVDRAEEILGEAARTPELALFGRMIADRPEWNIDAACQVAHAFSTHRVSMEFDFYTAIDDLRPEDTEGSDMMGTVEFNSACFYRYAVLDLDELRRNLGDVDLERSTVNAFLRASIVAIPTGKQNSMAAHNPPSYLLTIVRGGGAPWSLANAFVKPVRVKTQDDDVVLLSTEALERHLHALAKMYGSAYIKAAIRCTTTAGDKTETEGFLPLLTEANVDRLIQKTVEAAFASA